MKETVTSSPRLRAAAEWLPLIFAGRLPAVAGDTPEHLAVNNIFAPQVSGCLYGRPEPPQALF
jgi:hypothetical protein